ncbi:hypothetical protein AB0L26_29290 [Streptomyces nondiastaticus]|uniref:hypothetical protein n=1 Tax=Streptomyces nondiastaticus TaxID=3154512 RepID=UPI0034401CE8
MTTRSSPSSTPPATARPAPAASSRTRISSDHPLHIAQHLPALGPEAALAADPELAPHLVSLGQRLLDTAPAITEAAENDTGQTAR